MAHLELVWMGFTVSQLNYVHKCLNTSANVFLFSHTESLSYASVGGVCVLGWCELLFHLTHSITWSCSELNVHWSCDLNFAGDAAQRKHVNKLLNKQ